MSTTLTHSKTKTARTERSRSMVPELRFSEFEGNWSFVTLKDVSTKIAYGLNAAAKDFDGSNKYIRITDIDESTHLFDPDPLTSPEGNLSDDFKVRENDILFARTGASVGKSYLYNNNDGNLYFAGFLIRCNIDKENARFIFYQTQTAHYAKWVQVFSMRSGQPGLNAEEYKSYPIQLPSLPEQQKIASFLGAVDEKIQQLNRKKALLEQYKKGVMQQIFSQKIRFKDDTSTSLSAGNGNDYPDWEEKRLGELTYKVGKKNKENIQYPIYSINNQEGFRPQSEQFDGLDSNDRGYDISMYKIVHPDTFAYNPARINVGSIGYSYELNEVIISSLYVCFKTEKELEDLYLLAYLDSYTFKKDILRYEEGGVRQYLFYENFSHIKIPLPSVEEQKMIAKYLNALDGKVKEMDSLISKAQEFKKGLLQKMFI